ncbi:MAG TPA: hypothetical protein VFX86_00180 [Candidatus Saccharimonadales bacterium]|nr:hypothetical protein [Candidatus Saccharimonadales bacterium]
MDQQAVRTELAPYEKQLPHSDDLVGVYNALARVVVESGDNYGYLEDGLAERIVSDNLDMRPGTELFESVQSALEANGDEIPEKALEAGVALADVITAQSTNPRRILTGYLNVCFEVDKLKIGLKGKDHQASMANEHAILLFARAALVDHIEPNDKSFRILNNVVDTLQGLSQRDAFFSWFEPKLQIIGNDIHARYVARKTAEQFKPASQESVEEYGGAVEIQDDISSFMAETMKQRKYGVKPAYTAASIGGSWVFYDGADFNKLLHLNKNRSALSNEQLAVIIHTPKTDFSNLKVERKEIKFSSTANLVMAGGAIEEMQPDMQIFLYKTGELYLDSQGMAPLRPVLEDMPGVYESIQAELIANFHDLVVPAKVVDEARMQTVSSMTESQRKNYDPVLQLLLPRLKHRTKLLDQEEEQSTKPKRSVREHGVEWFVRDLPRGWSASPAAVEQAKLHNIELGPNETFVRSHTRGKSNAVLGHKVVGRTIKAPGNP